MEYLDLTTIIIRLTAAFVAGLVVGIERQVRTKPIGFGTFTLVSAGACAFMLVTENLMASGFSIPIAAGVVTGIGFLGAGALIKEGPSVMGFTTASAIWLIGATGVAFGGGYFVLGIITTLQCLSVFFIDYIFEKRGYGGHSRRLTISFDQRPLETKIMKLLAKFRPKVEGLDITPTSPAFTYIFRVRINLEDLEELSTLVMSLEGVTKFNLE
jgi:putative Mg2+ transporter-C (MgtC) family protein